MTTKNPELKVGLAWQTLSSTNLGVAALAESQIALAQAAAQRAGVSLSFISFCHSEKNPDVPRARGIALGDPLSPKRILLGRTAVLWQLAECAVVLDIGEGDSFSDIYGFKRLFLLSLLKICAVRAGSRLVLSPQTIGPFQGTVAKMLARRAMKGAHRVFARDHLSKSVLDEMGVDAPTDEVIDVAFRLPYERTARAPDGKVHVGLNVSGLLFNGGYTQNNQFGLTVDYAAVVRSLITRFLARDDVVLHLVSHVISPDFPVEDDHAVCARLQSEFPSCVLAPAFRSAQEAKSYISSLDFFAGARMHACIGAFSSGVPVVPMAYSRKFNGLFQSVGYRYLADLKADNESQVVDKVLAGFDQRHALAQDVAQGREIAEKKLQRFEDYLTELFTEAARSRSA